MYLQFIRTNVHYSEQAIIGLFSEHTHYLDDADFSYFSDLALDFLDVLYDEKRHVKKYFAVFFYLYAYKKLPLLELCSKLHFVMYTDKILADFFKDKDLVCEIENFLLKKQSVFSVLADDDCVVHEQHDDDVTFSECLDVDDEDSDLSSLLS